MSRYQEWINTIDIVVDYYSAFIKAWIAFNSWYRSEYTERTDREIVEKLKSQNNRFKGYIDTLLDPHNVSETAQQFNGSLKRLQIALSTALIYTQERKGVTKQISFSEIAIANPKTTSEGDYRSTHYKIQRSGAKITTVVSKKNNLADELFRFEQDAYEETELDSHVDFRKLSLEQQGQCKAFYKEVCPYVVESVLRKDKNNNVSFIEERAKVSRGVIEVLYLLRCSLMHGEVSPDKNSAEVYRYAYEILAIVLKNLI